MANEAVFERMHPLDRYLAESIDDAFSVNMPGASDELLAEQPSLDHTMNDQTMDGGAPWKPAARWAIQAIAALLEYASITDTPAMAFAERFKYVIISSNLLDTSLSPSTTVPYTPRFSTPPASPTGTTRLPPPFGPANGSRPSSHFDLNSPPISPPSSTPPSSASSPVPSFEERLQPHQPFWKAFLASPTTRRNMPIVAIVFVLALNGYFVLALLALFTLKTSRTKEREEQASARNASYSSTLYSLQGLISASDAWNSVVNEAMGTLEQEERRLFYGPTPSTTPSSSVRVALSSTLLSTQSHTDNVRQLFTPLTSSSQLARLSEMYAPPPPTPKPLSTASPQRRPASISTVRSNRSSLFASPLLSDIRRSESTKQADKRSTWNGTGRSPLRRASSLQGLEPPGSSMSSPVGPSTSGRKRLSTVMGEDAETMSESAENEAGPSSIALGPSPSTPQRVPREDPFTATPPMTRRRRRNSSVSSSSAPSHLHVLHPSTAEASTPKITHSRSHSSLPTAKPSPARLALVQTTRHPLSLAALHDQLQAAIASKRFASAHLLALRFGDFVSSSAPANDEERREELELLDGEDESYWEDVRSVMGLLTSALEDGAARLAATLEENTQAKEKDMQPSPLAPGFPHRRESSEVDRRLSHLAPAPPNSASTATSNNSPLWTRPHSVTNQPGTPPSSAGFAPAPSHVARFASHVNALVDAMDNAKQQLNQCIAVVEARENPLSDAAERPPMETALQSYDRLRRELSVALREFERGRGSLLDLIKHHSAANAPPAAPAAEDSDEEDGIPALAHDQSSVEADSDDRHGPLLPVHAAIYNSGMDDEDEASGRQLRIAAADADLLPPPHGIEQVFAYDSHKDGQASSSSSLGAAYVKDKPKLTREERIALAKSKRSSAQSPDPAAAAAAGSDAATWGPGGEVVQELKSVIMRVEERRRKEASKRLSVLGELATSPSPEPVMVIAPAVVPEEPPTLDVSREPSPSALAPPPAGVAVPYIGVAL